MVLSGMDYSGLERLYTAEQTQALDSAAIHSHGIPGITLMARAAQASFDCLLSLWPQTNCVQILCGTGSNGGDGYLLADIAHKRGIDVTVWQLGNADRISGDAALALQQAVENGVEIRTFCTGCLANSGVVVDAMLGTGLSGDLREPFAGAVSEVNALDVPVLAIDIPSGLCADSGRILGVAVKAEATATFIGLKRGMVTAGGQDHVGELQFSSLGVPPDVYEAVPTKDYLLDLSSLLEQFPQRRALSHKGSYGRVLIIGGGEGMAGAAALAGEAALRCGAGLVAVATRVEHVSALVARTPELMVSGVRSGLELQHMVDSATVLVIGPGLGTTAWSEQLLQVALASGKPMVIDADALNLLARDQGVLGIPQQGWVLTPHPGEAARLLNVSSDEVQMDRFSAVRELQRRYGGVVVLKGNGSLVASSERVGVSDYGNPGMASGGMGDVLSGVLGALLAQGLAPADAASLGVCAHGAAADIAAEEGVRGLIASDLIPSLRTLLG